MVEKVEKIQMVTIDHWPTAQLKGESSK